MGGNAQVIDDLGTDPRGGGTSSAAALEVMETIERSGGEAIANGANIVKHDEVQAIVNQAMQKWGRINVLVNNAGILRDSNFAKNVYYESAELWSYYYDLILQQSLRKFAFGKYLHQHGAVAEWIARSRIEIEQARLLVLTAGYLTTPSRT